MKLEKLLTHYRPEVREITSRIIEHDCFDYRIDKHQQIEERNENIIISVRGKCVSGKIKYEAWGDPHNPHTIKVGFQHWVSLSYQTSESVNHFQSNLEDIKQINLREELDKFLVRISTIEEELASLHWNQNYVYWSTPTYTSTGNVWGDSTSTASSYGQVFKVNYLKKYGR